MSISTVTSSELAAALGATIYEVESAAVHGYLSGFHQQFMGRDLGWTFEVGKEWRKEFQDGLARYRAAVKIGLIAG